jgi:hypothetical protein
MTVPGALRRSRGRLNVYGGKFRVARALLDVVAGVDPGAVRLAATLLGLIPSRRRTALRDAELARRESGGFSTRGDAR